MTPISNPRHVNHVAAPHSFLNASPTPATNSHTEITFDEANESVGELLQATATSQGRWDDYYNKFITACQQASILCCAGVVPHSACSDDHLGGTEEEDPKRV